MSVSAVSSNKTAYATGDSSSSAPVVNGPKTLGVDDFMKLLATQFQQQDPLKPMDDTAFVAQTAQFTSLQQTSSLLQQITQLGAQQNLANANSFLGRQVTLNLGHGETTIGTVTAVDASGTSPQVVVNGKSYDAATVIRVEPAPLSSNTPTTASPTPAS